MFSSLLTLVTIGLAASGLAAPVAELEARQSCADVIVVYARGTNQASPIGDPQSVSAFHSVCKRDSHPWRLGRRTPPIRLGLRSRLTLLVLPRR